MKQRKDILAAFDMRPTCSRCVIGRMDWHMISERELIQWEESILHSEPVEHNYVCPEDEGDFLGGASLARLIQRARDRGNPIKYLKCGVCQHMEPLTADEYARL